MSTTFLISDTHFGHEGIVKFLRDDGSKLRPWDTVDEMDIALIQNWNSVVKPQDKVYHLGDLIFNKKKLWILGALNGDKVLIKGNHDQLPVPTYLKYFRDIRAVHRLDKCVLTHIPIHPESLTRWGTNIHGHLHANTLNDPRYINVSVEQINYTPVAFDEVKKWIS